MAGTNKLTDPKVNKAKPKAKPYKLADGGGMFLLVNPDGSKYWRLSYRYAGKQKTIGLGVYPATPLANARIARDEARTTLAAGADPSAARQARKRETALASTNSFEAVAREWFDRKHRPEMKASHSGRNMRRLEQYLFPQIGKRPIGEITPGELLKALQRIEDQEKIETARRVRTLAAQIFRYAIPSGRASRDIAADLKDSLKTAKTTHHPAITNPEEIGPLLRAIWAYTGRGSIVASALRLAPLLFVRPGELRNAKWSEFRIKSGEWDYAPSKGAHPLLFPLPKQAVTILRELHELTGDGTYLFPGARSKERPISEVTLNAALNRIGYKDVMTMHGFRAMARTVLAERLNFPPDVIEMQLAHAVKDPNGRAYNRTTYLEQRRVMLQAWADYLDALRTGEQPIIGGNGNPAPT